MSAVEGEVDGLLLEQGEYMPLELLLQTGRLMYSDYEAWRRGELPYLDQALFGDPGQVLEMLARAEAYLERRGWQPEPLCYRPWGGRTANAAPLRFSANAALDVCFHRRYRRPHDQPQLDLFTDSPGTALQNGVLLALEERHVAGARRGLGRLYDVAPDHPRLGALERLTEALEAVDRPVEDVAAELTRLEEKLTPLADELLGTGSRNLLIPLWRRLSAALQESAFDPARPRLHLSYSAARSLDWDIVQQAVEREPGWRRHPVLLERFAVAAERRHELNRALPAWFTLCWRFPDRAAAIGGSANRMLSDGWSAFQDRDVALPPPAFPAWLLVQRPALTKSLPEPDDCPDSYATLYRLQRRHDGQPPDQDVLALRARLREQDPLLFDAYMAVLKGGSAFG
jgi:hypothetical protein